MAGMRGRAAAMALAAIWIALLAPLGAVPVPVAQAASTDLTVVTTATYTVEPAQQRVRVVVDATIANHRADTRVNRFFFDHAFLAVQPGAASPAVAKGPPGAAVSVSSRTADATTLRLDFGSRLYGGHSISLRFAFNLADTGTSARRLIRVGTSLITFPVWAYASNGASGSRVAVRFPTGYDVAVESGSFAAQTRTSDGGTLLVAGPLASPLTYFAYVSAQQPAAYLSSPLTVATGGGPIALTLQAWQDDATWATRVGGLFSQALPVLQADIGLPWPHAAPVVVKEAVSRSAGGYAGLYDPKTGQIQVAYWASSAVAVQEAAHGWFNGTLVADRWAAEGFASLYAQRALGKLKIAATPPRLTAALKAVAFPLNAWAVSPAPSSSSEAYGYAASYALATLVAARAGPAALARVWADAARGLGAYQPPAGQGSGAPETVAAPPDWRGLLDLLEAETGQDFTDLWRAWVVRPAEAGLLDQRAATRAAYASVLAAADGWALPRSIRDALRAWQFGTASAELAAARQVLTARVGLERAAQGVGVTLPSRLRSLFEAGDLVGALQEAQAEETAISEIEGAAASRPQAGDLTAMVGMLGSDPAGQLAAAKAALGSGDPASAATLAQAAAAAWAQAPDEGRRRLLMAAALAAALLVLGASLASRVRPGLSRRAPGSQ